MQKINLRELYPEIYKTDTYLEVTDEVQAVFLADKRAEARYLRQMYNYKAHYSLNCDNGIEKAIGAAGQAGQVDLCPVLPGHDRQGNCPGGKC